MKVLLFVFSCLALSVSCQKKMEYYKSSDFKSVKKVDAHLHINTDDGRYLEFATLQNFSILSPNVDAGTPVEKQLSIAAVHRQNYPGNFAFLGTFTVDSRSL